MLEKSYKQLIVWQRSITLVKEIYQVTNNLPKSELFVLTSQMRRAAISISSNIAEGYKRGHRKEYLQFLRTSEASAAELETQLIIVKEIYPHIPLEMAISLLTEVQKMLYVIIMKLK